MLVFVDESGDPGLKIEQGASRYFSVALVVFEDHDEANACDQRIELLEKELRWKKTQSEFHFKHNSDRVRKAFLHAVSPYNFFYYGIVINKDPQKLYGPAFQQRETFYHYACSLLFENAKERLEDAIVVIDGSGSTTFKRELATYLRKKTNSPSRSHIKAIKIQRSSSNRLLQLADFIAGVINRQVQDKKNASDYHKIIGHREIYVQIWPK